jgi:uncharacterized glyoxalase superfamily protein PhnB
MNLVIMTNQTNDSFEFKAIPTLGITDYQTAINFYLDTLGFKIDCEHRFTPTDPIYMQISKNGLILHLSCRLPQKQYVLKVDKRS